MESDGRHNAFLNRLAKWDDRDLFQAEQDIRGLRDHPGYRLVERLLEQAHESVVRQMVYAAKPLEQAEYTRLAGMADAYKRLPAAAEAVLIAAERAREKAEAEIRRESGAAA